MSKIKLPSLPINIPNNLTKKPIIQKTFFPKADFDTLGYIKDLYKQEKYDEIILRNINIKRGEGLHPLDQNLILEILKYQICSSFQLNNCNKAQDFILQANPFFSSNSEKILSFYESILQTLKAYDNNILILFEPTKSYLQSVVSYVEELKKISELYRKKEDFNNESSLFSSDSSERAKDTIGNIACYEDIASYMI